MTKKEAMSDEAGLYGKPMYEPIGSRALTEGRLRLNGSIKTLDQCVDVVEECECVALDDQLRMHAAQIGH